MSADDFVSRMQDVARQPAHVAPAAHLDIERGVQRALARRRARPALQQAAGAAAAVTLILAAGGTALAAVRYAGPVLEKAGQALCADMSQAYRELAQRSMPRP